MRSIFIQCLLVLLSAGLVRAQPLQKKLEISVVTGYERQGLNWSIAGNQNGQSPNIYSELQWKKVSGQSVSASLQWNFWNKLVLMGDYSRIFIRSGTVTDNDYNGDNRTDPAYNQLFDADRGFTRELRAGLGYRLVNTDKLSLTSYLGYGASKQSLHLLDRSGQFPDLNSTYETNWKGPYVKAAALARLVKNLKVVAAVAYNQVNYNATADWNLVPAFQHPVSYRHTAKGYGIDANAGFVYSITPEIAVNIGGGYYTWHTGTGIDELYLNSGGSDKTQLNSVVRSGYRFLGGLTFSF
ncbi:hypothetical protein A0256_04795 [Mucilaginibacter sp. PAMC 26640]|nr:hypothetical protein A0256_04795 [Mucilaginibacter sp. PAMC 26640]